jgi:serine/threonine-protein kinase RsbW
MARKHQVESEVMVQTHTLAVLPRPAQCSPYVELSQSLPSEVAAISPFADQLMIFVHQFRDADGSEVDIEIALREALANAVIHGNHEDPHKRVQVSCRCGIDGEVFLTVSDQGQGFENSAAPDPTAPENVEFTHGRGIYLMKTLMDEVCFERSGATVHMRKKSVAAPPVLSDKPK